MSMTDKHMEKPTLPTFVPPAYVIVSRDVADMMEAEVRRHDPWLGILWTERASQ